MSEGLNPYSEQSEFPHQNPENIGYFGITGEEHDATNPKRELTPEEIEAGEINRENEAKAVQEMVDMGILTPDEAPNFDWNAEINISENVKDGPAQVSERLAKWIISKLPPEKFNDENLKGESVHGTFPRAIPEIWQATGKLRTYWGNPNSKGASWRGVIPLRKGIFCFCGELDKISGVDSTLELPRPQIPIQIINNPKFETLDDYYILEPGAIVLNPQRTVEEEIGNFKRQFEFFNRQKDEETTEIYKKSIERLERIKQLSNEKKYNWGDYSSLLCLSIKQMVNFLSNAMAKGVDKSKLVPIYDLHGNLLWPLKNMNSDDMDKKPI